MIRIDLRGKSMGEVSTLVKEKNLGSGKVNDVTHLWGLSGGKYKKAISIELDSSVTERMRTPATVLFITRNSERKPIIGDDIHGLVRSDNYIEWGIKNTLDLLR